MGTDYKLQNRDVVSSIYKRYYADLKAYLMSYTHQGMKAEDMIQDLFLRVLDMDVIHEESAKGLLLTMAHRMIIDDARHRAFVRRQESKIRQTASVYDQTSIVDKVEFQQMTAYESRRLLKMPEKRAHVYQLWRHEEKTSQEIAKQMDLSCRTVESHLYMARKEMRDYLRNII
ncbi:MAG TPA: hypothetical protein DIS88_03995 [Prevotella sp.]|nr:hypothetical protein [Prevotella sp.]